MTAGLELLAELVAIPSHASQPEGIRRIGELVGAELRALGFQEVPPEPPSHRVPSWAEELLSPEASFDALLDPIVLRRPGTVPGRLLLLGDLDMALVTTSPRLVMDGKRALGPAVADMKGGLVVMVDALRQLGSRAAPEIVIVLSRDEQAGSLRSGATIEALGRTATWCLCFECGRDGDRVMTSRARVGVGRAVARVEGGYAGTAVNAAENASIVLGRALVVLGGVHDDRYRVTPTILRAGVRRSVIPSVGQAVLDVRARDDAAWAAMIARLEAVPAEIDQIGHLTFEAVAHRPALPRTPLTEAFLAFVRNVGTELGIHLAETGSFAAGSSAFIDSSRVAVLDGMGPAGGDLMTDREYIEVGSIGIRSALVAETTAHLAYWSGAAGH